MQRRFSGKAAPVTNVNEEDDDKRLRSVSGVGGPSHVDIPLHRVVRWSRHLCGVCLFVALVSAALGGERVHLSVLLPESQGQTLASTGHLRALTDNAHTDAAEHVDEVASEHGNSSHGSAHATTSGCGGDVHVDVGHGPAAADPLIPHPLNSVIGMLLIGYIICTSIDHCNILTPVWLRFPISGLLFIAGNLVYQFYKHVLRLHINNMRIQDLISGIYALAHVDPHAVFNILLPPLLYESASGMSWHVLRVVLPNSLLLAVPGVGLNVLMTTGFILGTVKDQHDHALPWASAALLASILSATDPVAVVAALRSLGAPKKLSSLIEGESLLNDGSAVVFFFVLRDVAAGSDKPDEEKLCVGDVPDSGCVIWQFIKLALGGALLGFAIGGLVHSWMKRARFANSVALELTIVLCAVYGSFFLAECVGISGVLAVVVFGMVMTAAINPVMSHEARHAHHAVLHVVGYLCDKMIFFISGIITNRFITFTGQEDCIDGVYFGAWGARIFGELIALYLWLHLSRAATVAAFWPMLSRLGYGLTWKEAVILIFGGLRGAVGLAMGLLIEGHHSYIPPHISNIIAFHTSGIVLMTMLINGCTVDFVYKKLELYPPNRKRCQYLTKIMDKLEDECQRGGFREMRKDWFFKDVHFRHILKCVPNFKAISFDQNGIPQPMNVRTVPQTLASLQAYANCHRQNSLPSLDEKETFESRWSARKCNLAKEIVKWIRSSVDAVCKNAGTAAGDKMINVTDVGDKMLEFRKADRPVGTAAGLYVSNRPLALISKEHCFSVELDKLGENQVIVGLLSDPMAEVDGTTAGEDQVLGSREGSFGFDCSTGDICIHLGGAPGERIVNSGPVPKENDVVKVSLQKDDAQTWSAVFRCGEGSSTELLVVGSCSLGSFSPEQLFPTIEFHAGDVEHNLSSTLASGSYSMPLLWGSGPREAASETSRAPDPAATPALSAPAVLQPAATGVAAGSGTVEDAPAASDPVGKAEAVSHAPAAPGTAGDAAEAETDPQTAPALDAGKATATLHVPSSQAPPADAKSPRNGHGSSVPKNFSRMATVALGSVGAIPAVKPTQAAMVRMSFEPQLLADAENLHEIFLVLFNTVIQRYNSLHDHGRLGDGALVWLIESANYGLDSANGALNAKKVSDFVDTAEFDGQDIQPDVEVAVSSKSSLRSLNRMMGGMEDGGDDDTYGPVVIEYLWLEQLCSKVSLVDKYPVNWPGSGRIRQYGYFRTRTKVEAMWAYVDCHEKVIKEFAGLKRFPGLIRLLECVIKTVKRDLMLIEDLNPRRVFYCKHYMACRVVLGKRLDQLKKQKADGWISAGDSEGLIDYLYERVVQVEQYFPRIESRWLSKSRLRIILDEVEPDSEEEDNDHLWGLDRPETQGFS